MKLSKSKNACKNFCWGTLRFELFSATLGHISAETLVDDSDTGATLTRGKFQIALVFVRRTVVAAHRTVRFGFHTPIGFVTAYIAARVRHIDGEVTAFIGARVIDAPHGEGGDHGGSVDKYFHFLVS